MNWFKTITVGALVCLAIPSLAEVGPWQLEAQDEDKDIQVFTRTVGDSPLKEFKGVTHIKSDVSAFVALLQDQESATTWLHNVIEYTIIDAPSSTESLIYTVNKTPWPVTDRDAYIRSVFSADKMGAVTSTITGESDFAEDSEDFVRMPELLGAWKFTPMQDGMVEVIYQVHANPGGSLPDWLVNSIVVETPMETLANLHEVITDEKYQKQTFAFIQDAMTANTQMALEDTLVE
jgi:hypothetical protein